MPKMPQMHALNVILKCILPLEYLCELFMITLDKPMSCFYITCTFTNYKLLHMFTVLINFIEYIIKINYQKFALPMYLSPRSVSGTVRY